MRCLSLLAVAATAATVSARYDFCGDTGIGFAKSLLDPVTGYGVAEVLSSDVLEYVAIEQGVIIRNRKTGSTVYSKLMECVYDVSINYETSSINVVTGTPGLKEKPSLRSCWEFRKGSGSSVSFIKNPVGAHCPNAHNSSTVADGALRGSIGSFSKTIPAGHGLMCPGDETVPLALHGMAGPYGAGLQLPGIRPGFDFIGPTFFATVEDDDTFVQYCARSARSAALLTAGSTTITGTITIAGATEEEDRCMRASFRAPVSVMLTNGPAATCPAYDASSASVRSWEPHPPAVPAIAALLPAPLTPPPVPTVPLVMEETPAVSFSSLINVPSGKGLLDLADPCSAWTLRAAFAASLSVSPSKLLISGLTEGAQSITFKPDDLVNLITSRPDSCLAATRRMLKADESSAEARSLQGGVTAAMVAAGLQTSTVTGVTTGPSLAALGSGFSAAAPSGAAATVVALLVPRVFPARVNPYVPDANIKQFHAIPRFSLTGGPTPDNNFKVDMAYFQGAIAPAGGIIALAVIALVIYVIAYWCACCRCCHRCRPRNRTLYQSKGCRKTFGVGRAFILLAIINVALLLSCIAYNSKYVDGIDKLFEAKGALTGTLRTGQSLVASTSPVHYTDHSMGASLKTGAANSKTAAQALQTSCSSSSCPQAVNDILTAVVSGTGVAVSTATDIGATLGDAAKTLEDATSSVDINQVKQMAGMAGYALFGILSFSLLSFSLLICKNRCACCLFKVLAPINLILVVLITILAAVFYAIGIIGSDVCYEPSTSVFALINQTSASMAAGLPGQTLKYYLQCGADPTLPYSGALKLIDENSGTLGTAVAQANSLAAQVEANPSGLPALSSSGQVPYMAWGLSNASAALHTLSDDTLSCASMDPIMSQLFNGLCNDGIATMIGLFKILIAAAVLLICQLGVGTDLCCYHPGDKNAWVDEDAAEAGESAGPGSKGADMAVSGHGKPALVIATPAAYAAPAAAV